MRTRSLLSRARFAHNSLARSQFSRSLTAASVGVVPSAIAGLRWDTPRLPAALRAWIRLSGVCRCGPRASRRRTQRGGMDRVGRLLLGSASLLPLLAEDLLGEARAALALHRQPHRPADAAR